jgi:hypothetical protein
MEIVRPNQVWAMDITYIPMARGFVYLAVVLDWFSRRVLSWGVSITMEAAFCVETLEDALARHGKPDIFNSDQGSQFTGWPSPVCWPATALRSVWTVKGLGGTTCSSSACGAASNTRRYICGPTKVYPRLALRSAATWTFIMAGVHTRGLTVSRRSSLLNPAATPLGSLSPAEAPLIDAENLFRQPGPPLSSHLEKRCSY